MKFFFPDSQDFVDPGFDFGTETWSESRVRQQTDRYAHELFPISPYDGILVSLGIVDGNGSSGGKYSQAERFNLRGHGARQFFRLDGRGDLPPLQSMGDCGAFSYVDEKVPPFTVDAVVEFYALCGFDYGISVDHVIPVYRPELDEMLSFDDMQGDGKKWRDRQQMTLELAYEFLTKARQSFWPFEPIGVAQGWSPTSYQRAVVELQRMGYQRIALGGMAPLRKRDVAICLRAVADVRNPSTQLHVLGVAPGRELVAEFVRCGVTSFDTTSPLRQAFKDNSDNYYTFEGSYQAVRVPMVEGSFRVQRRIVAGELDGAKARSLERICLARLRAYDEGHCDLESALVAVLDYEEFLEGNSSRADAYRSTLGDRPWRECCCPVCEEIGIHVVLFRGAERNRRRGFHNLHVFRKRLEHALAAGEPVQLT